MGNLMLPENPSFVSNCHVNASSCPLPKFVAWVWMAVLVA